MREVKLKFLKFQGEISHFHKIDENLMTNVTMKVIIIFKGGGQTIFSGGKMPPLKRPGIIINTLIEFVSFDLNTFGPFPVISIGSSPVLVHCWRNSTRRTAEGRKEGFGAATVMQIFRSTGL